VVATDGVADYVTTSDLQASVLSSGTRTDQITSAVSLLLSAAVRNGSEENMTAVMVKRI
jgi:hypothetical protein